MNLGDLVNITQRVEAANQANHTDFNKIQRLKERAKPTRWIALAPLGLFATLITDSEPVILSLIFTQFLAVGVLAVVGARCLRISKRITKRINEVDSLMEQMSTLKQRKTQ